LRRGGRRESELFLVEGVHLVGAAIEAGWPFEFVLYSGDLLTSNFGRGLVAGLGSRAEEISAPIFESIAGKENPQGIMGIARRRHVTLDSLPTPEYGAAVTSPQDPGNLGTILRTLDAVGGSALFVLDGGVDPYHPTAVRAGMGATFVIPTVEAEFDEFDRWRRARGLQLIGSSAHATTDYREIRPSTPWILLMGSEQKGLSESQQRACDTVANLPMRGRATSVNLAVAAGVLLFQFASALRG
jgi:TrmH family RNA methyltransferase